MSIINSYQGFSQEAAKYVTFNNRLWSNRIHQMTMYIGGNVRLIEDVLRYRK